jgi:hypothetical protein
LFSTPRRPHHTDRLARPDALTRLLIAGLAPDGSITGGPAVLAGRALCGFTYDPAPFCGAASSPRRAAMSSRVGQTAPGHARATNSSNVGKSLVPGRRGAGSRRTATGWRLVTKAVDVRVPSPAKPWRRRRTTRYRWQQAALAQAATLHPLGRG